MCKILYKIFDNGLDVSNKYALQGKYGYFKIILGNHSYGEFIEEMNLDILSVCVDEWFLNLGKALMMLEKYQEIYISDIETPAIWIKIVNFSEKDYEVSLISSSKPNGTLGLEKTLINKINEIEWTEKVSKTSFIEAYQKALATYLVELKAINSENYVEVQELGMVYSKIVKLK